MTSGRASREARAAKIAAARLAVARAESRRRHGIRAAVVATVLIVVVGIGWVVQARRAEVASEADAPPPAGTSGAASQSILVGAAAAPVTLTTYEDFQCPACKDFEEKNATKISQLVAAGKLKVEYRPIAFLDRASSTSYSTRALNAAGCVVSKSPTVFAKFHETLFKNQPAENTAGLSDDKLVALAKEVGSADIADCVKEKKYKAWTKRVTDQFSKDGHAGTPTVLINGTKAADLAPAAFAAALDQAIAKSAASSAPSASPKPSLSPKPSASVATP